MESSQLSKEPPILNNVDCALLALLEMEALAYPAPITLKYEMLPLANVLTYVPEVMDWHP
jgi:hypothetical protein